MTDNDVQGQRISSLDIMKGLMMILIVVIHIIYLAESDTERPTSSSPIVIQMMYLGMMLFFISSGYFFRPGRGIGKNIRKRMVQLLVPILIGLTVLPAILYVYLTVLGQGPTLDDLLPSYKAILGGVNVFRPYDEPYVDVGMCFVFNGYYFLQLLVVAFLLFYPLAEKVLDDRRKLIVSIVILIACTALLREFVDVRLPFYSQLSPLAAAFMLFGAALGRRQVVEYIENGEKDLRYWSIFAGALAVTVVMELLFPTGTGFDNTFFGDFGGYSAFTYFIASCSMCYVLLVIGSLFSKIPLLSSALSVSGRHPIALICLHIFVIKLFMAPFHHLSHVKTFPQVPMTEAVIYWIVAVTIIVLAAEYIPRYIGKHTMKTDAEGTE